MSYNPRDLHITIRASGKRNLVYNGGPEGSIFPGWFIEVAEYEGYTRYADHQLGVNQVIEIAEKIDRVVYPLNTNHTISNAVKRCDSAMRDEILRQLKVAEDMAAKIPNLKKMLGE